LLEKGKKELRVEEINNSVVIWGPLSKEGLSYLKDTSVRGSIVLVPENRPYLIGLKHNLALLKKEKIPYVYCTDNMLGFLFRKGKIKETVIFYKKILDEKIIALCGSLFIFYLARLHNVTVKFFLQAKINLSGLDKDASSLGGKSFVLSQDRDFVEQVSDEIIDKDYQALN
jgi:methylthioribose-1-phosphate isomerase